MSATTTIQQFEVQKTRHATMKDRVVRLTAIRETETANLQRAEAEALVVLGTSDVPEIRRKYQEGTESNASAVAKLTSDLDAIDQKVSDIERLTNAVR